MGDPFSFPGVRPKALLCWGGNVGAAAQAAERWGSPATAALAVDALEGRIEVCSPGRLKKLRVRRTTAVAGGTSVVYTVRVNGVNTGITITITAGQTVGQDLTNQAAVAPGDVVEINITVGSGAPANDRTAFSVEQEF